MKQKPATDEAVKMAADKEAKIPADKGTKAPVKGPNPGKQPEGKKTSMTTAKATKPAPANGGKKGTAAFPGRRAKPDWH